MERLVCLAIGYVFGLFQTGYFYGKRKGIDIRTQGSGNAGTTNALRTMGAKAGGITLVGDAFKCIFAVLLVKLIFRNSCPGMLPLLGIYAGFGATLGHNYPFYLKFKGGKGIAVMGGFMLVTDLRIAGICALVFTTIVLVTKYVSLASLTISVLFEALLIIFGQLGAFGMSQKHLLEMYVVGAAYVFLAFVRHRKNIKRLCEGTENKISLRKKK